MSPFLTLSVPDEGYYRKTHRYKPETEITIYNLIKEM